MNVNRDFPMDGSLEDEAAAWVCEREEGFTPARAAAFAAWQRADRRHAEAVARVEQALALLDEMPAVRGPLTARFGKTDTVEAFPGMTSRWQARAAGWISVAAAVLVVGLVLWWRPVSHPTDVEHYAAEAGGPRRIALRDGSVVDLNGGGRLDVAWLARERRVALQAGEAHFQVAPDAARPFIVSAGGVAVRAVGTAFNVQLAAAEVSVLVTEGKVQVEREVSRDATPAAKSVAAPAALLAANERTVVPTVVPAVAAAPKVEQVSPEKVRALLAWQNPVTTFVDAPLRDIVRQFNRRNTVQLVLADAALGERKIGAVIALDQVEAFVRLLEQDGDIVAAPRGEREIVLRRAR